MSKVSVYIKYFLLVVSGLINAFGVCFFIYSNNLFDSGISGLSIFLDKITSDSFNLSMFLVLLNIPMFILGYKKVGLKFIINASIALLSYSLFSLLFNHLISTYNISIVGDDLFLAAIFGGMLSGIGSGLAIYCGGVLDGVEVLALLFAQKLTLSVGNFIMLFNTILYIFVGIYFNNYILPMYSFVAYILGTYLIDQITSGVKRGKACMIISDKYKEICNELSLSFKLGLTVFNCYGFYSKANKKAIYILLNRFQINKLKEIVNQIDKEAFVTISDVVDNMKE